MTTVSNIQHLIAGLSRQIDLSAAGNALQVNSLIVGLGTTSTLTQAILANLITLQNGTLNVGVGLHAHDGIYTRTTALASAAGGTAGSTLIGDDNSYSNFTPSAATVKGALAGIDTKLGTVSAAAITSLTGDVTATGPGAAAATVAKIQGTTVAGTTGTVNVVFSASPTLTGTLTAAAVSLTGTLVSTSTLAGTNLTAAGHASADLALAGGTMSGAINMGSFQITNLAPGVAGTDAINLTQLQNAINGLNWKTHVRAMSTSNITLSGTQTVDGVALVAGDDVLVNGQTTTSANGIYTVAAGAWSRRADATTGTQLVGAAVFVDEGTVNALTGWVQQTAAPITVGTTAISFAKFASVTPYVFRNGLLQTGQNVDVVAGDNSLTSTTGSLVVKIAPTGGLQTVAAGVAVLPDPAGALTTSSSGLKVAVDGTTIQIVGDALSTVPQSSTTRTLVAGQSFAANTTYAVRWGQAANGETAGRVYAADYGAATNDNFYVIGLASSGSAVTAGQNLVVTTGGSYTLASGDTTFASNDTGRGAFLTAAGAFVPLSGFAPTTNQATTRVGMVMTTTSVYVQVEVVGVN